MTALTATPSSAALFTEKQGQYLAFIYCYALINRRAPAEADMQEYFQVTPPSVHSMVVQLERRGLIRRVPRQARSIELLIAADQLPPLRPQPIKTTVVGYYLGLMQPQFGSVMAARTDAELLAVFAAPDGSYRPEAIAAAREEAAKRNLAVPSPVEADEARRALNESRANVPLASGWVIATILFPVACILWLPVASSFERNGYTRKARSLRRIAFTFIGAYAVLLVGLFITLKVTAR